MDRTEESLKALVGIKRTNDTLDRIVKQDMKNYGLNITEFAVMELLYHKGDQPIQKVKQRILIASSSTTYVIDQLVKKAYVTRRQDTEDKRITYAVLTEKGHALMEQIFPQHAETIEKAFSILDDEELAIFRRALKKISAFSTE
ncbi:MULTISPECIES: MarR family winged helix-turn-helix transcriptional regulator [Mammaliicoccus]|uniref:MarR family transcriptional regulator n=1 Tax=Mammaliicoccus fleurettii TaxID=150056 RepID=A0ABS5MR09_9STAP|nr:MULTISPECIES: MarR family transcriptional regulator [Mammaliicoccus]HCN60723.1 MarR family transcriptional regulator [Staphylococcus sp.]MBL0848284.1 MarR family transcriptional regulator [Mammaliicoccus fleurettii]MBO3063447.1 MarR family transcriptional regulator [Mammaliicoccus fleurettii]MBS3673006.1 MarR family transcriptional regulator [Mammaliicoccus fleurettii]MBS3698094.1 MarR family transcriptional regulator [Mammaliicoccus fleurettii]